MMSLFLLVIFTQATRAGNNSKAETFPLGLQEGAAVRTLVAVARAPAREVGALRASQDTRLSPLGCHAALSSPTVHR